MALLAASGISKSYSARLLFDGVSFEIAPRDKVGLVGVNGCGKTTLFRILTGEEAPDTGSVMKHKGARMGFMRQNVENTSDTLYQSTVAAFDHLIRIEQELERISEEISNGGSDVSSLISHQQSLNERYEREGDVDEVVFPSGWVVDEKTGLLKMYYGAADSSIAMATASVSDLLDYIRQCPEPRDEALY